MFYDAFDDFEIDNTPCDIQKNLYYVINQSNSESNYKKCYNCYCF